MTESPGDTGPSQRLQAQRRRGVESVRVRFPGKDLRPRRGGAGANEVPEARSLKGRQVLIAVAGAALLVRDVARTDFGEHQEQAARRAWELLGGLLAQLESATPRMHADLAKRNAVLLDRMRSSLGQAAPTSDD